MSALTTPQRFLAQPQYRVTPDVNNPLGARIIGGCIPGVCSLRGNAASIVKVRGSMGLGTAGGSGNYATAGLSQVLLGRSVGAVASSRDITFIFVGNVSNNVSTWFYDGQSDSLTSWWFRTDASGNFSASYGQSTNLAGTVPIPNGPVVIICHGGTNGGQVARTWVNGVEYAGTAATDSWTNSPAFSAMFGSSAFPTTNMFAGTGNFAVALRGNVTSAEAKTIYDNCWALVKAPDTSRMFIGAPAATGTVALSGNAVTTATGSLTPNLSLSVAGNQATTSVGSFSTSISFSLQGNQITSSVGVLESAITLSLSGNGMTASAGTLSPVAGGISLTGNAASSGFGTFGVTISTPLSGSLSNASSGDIGVSGGNVTVALSGNQIISSNGSLGLNVLTLSQADIDAIASAVWANILESSFSSGDLLRLIAAMAAGKVSGAHTGTETFRDVSDTKNRIVATVDSQGNRSAITIDAV